MTESLALVVTTVISVTGALVSVFYAHRLRRAAQVEEADQLALRFREPVLRAAFNLQSRLYNIVRQDFLDDFLVGETSSPEEREYAVSNTAYLIGQYLGWVEVIRRESQYMDPRSRSRNREIVERLERSPRHLRGEQRAEGPDVAPLPRRTARDRRGDAGARPTPPRLEFRDGSARDTHVSSTSTTSTRSSGGSGPSRTTSRRWPRSPTRTTNDWSSSRMN